MKTVNIYFSDLREQAQQEVLEATGIKDPTEGNFEVIPLAVLEFEEEEEK